MIPAKPTRYRGITFASVLEARWAVFFDHWHKCDYWTYEPITWRSKEGYNYTPDFYVKQLGIIEIKPVKPRAYYIEEMQKHVDKVHGQFIWLACGSWWKSQTPRMYRITKHTNPAKLTRGHALATITRSQSAIKMAKSYRFDI